MHTSRSRSRIEAIAHERRRHPTFTEAKLWQRLKGSQLGVGFRREFVIGRYIVDLCAPSRRLVVEVDGGYHALVQSRDARGTERFSAPAGEYCGWMPRWLWRTWTQLWPSCASGWARTGALVPALWAPDSQWSAAA